MGRAVTLLIIFALVLAGASLTGCGQSANRTEGAKSKTTEAKMIIRPSDHVYHTGNKTTEYEVERAKQEKACKEAMVAYMKDLSKSVSEDAVVKLDHFSMDETCVYAISDEAGSFFPADSPEAGRPISGGGKLKAHRISDRWIVDGFEAFTD